MFINDLAEKAIAKRPDLKQDIDNLVTEYERDYGKTVKVKNKVVRGLDLQLAAHKINLSTHSSLVKMVRSDIDRIIIDLNIKYRQLLEAKTGLDFQ